MTDPTSKEELRVIFEGRVQGVGFRATVHELADEFDVSGWVANAGDGTVHMTAQGAPKELRQFIERILEVRRRYVVNHRQQWQRETVKMRGFEIRPDIMNCR